MKNLFVKLILLFAVYYLIQFAYSFFSKGYNKDYIIVNEYTFNINEIYTANKKNEIDNYLIKVLVDNKEFLFQAYHNFGKKQKIVTNVHYYKDENYACVYPEFEGNVQLFDLTCISGDYYINYTSIDSKPKKMVEFVENITSYKKYNNEPGDAQKYSFSTIYVDNIIKEHYIALSNYRGIDLIKEGKVRTISVFEKDIYKRPLSEFVGKKYMTADYSKTLYFENFNVIDLVTGEVQVLKNNKKINFNSYIMGTVKDSVYLIDKTNKIQYEIDLADLKVTVIGDSETGIRFYNNGNWEKYDITKAIKEEKKFIYNEKTDNIKIYKNGNKLSGYKYYFKVDNGRCEVYRSNIQDDTKKTYLFSMSDCNNQVVYLNDYIYYVDNTKLNYYSDKTGVKTLLVNNELKYNSNILIGGYVKGAK